jgi:hypothetical protein
MPIGLPRPSNRSEGRGSNSRQPPAEVDADLAQAAVFWLFVFAQRVQGRRNASAHRRWKSTRRLASSAATGPFCHSRELRLARTSNMERPQPVKRKSWRDDIRVHEAAEALPSLMSEGELRKLAVDIETRGLVQNIDINRDCGTGTDYILDGRNRLDAVRFLGWELVHDNGGLAKESVGQVLDSTCSKPEHSQSTAERLPDPAKDC